MHVLHSLRRGGAERVALELSAGFADSGHEVLAVGLLNVCEYNELRYGRINKRFLLDPGKYHWPWRIPRLAGALSEAIDQFAPDVIEVHNATAAIVTAWAHPRVPTVQVFHGYGDLTRSRSAKAWGRRRLERWAFRKNGSRGIVISAPLASAAANHLGCASDRFTTVSNGIDVDAFPFSQREPTDRPVICVVGTLAEVKRTDHALLAFKLLLAQVPFARLLIVGDGPLRGRLESLVGELGLSEHVELLGRRTDVANVLARSHLLWQLSESEGLPLAILEAMASGVPVVGTEVRGIRDVIVEGKTGYLVPLGDDQAVVRRSIELLGDLDCYRSFAVASSERARGEFGRDRMVQAHLRVLDSVAQLREQPAIRRSGAKTIKSKS